MAIYKCVVKCSRKIAHLKGKGFRSLLEAGEFYGVDVDEVVSNIYPLLKNISRNGVIRSTAKINIEIEPCLYDEALEITIRGDER